MSPNRKLPTGRIARLTQLVKVGATTTSSLLLRRDSNAAAEHAAAVLGSLRGLAAKVGQMASYVDGFVPDEHHAAFEKALAGLRAAAPRSSSSEIVAVVEADLGATVGELFAEWEDEPFASASIGQVHRARLFDGREVAVKVQHPGIDQAVESDLKNASVVEGLISALGPRAINPKAIFDEVRERFREELDYTLEASRQEQFARLHAGDRDILVPDVIQDRCGRRVLTTVLAAGVPLEVAAEAAPEQRRHYAEVLWRFVFRGNLVAGMFNADPHPGNYLFRDDGSIAFLDFGCVQPISPEQQVLARGMHRSGIEGDEAQFREQTIAMMQTRGGSYEEAVLLYTRRCFEPLFDSPFWISRRYVADLVHGIQDLKKHMFSRDRSFTPLPPGMAFMNRLQFGFYSVLARLDVEVDYAEVERRFLGEANLW